MPTVLRQDGFHVVIFLPPREHAPPHVHVRHGDGEVVIELASRTAPQTVRTVGGMRAADVARAFWLVESNATFLLASWRRYHD